jgi:hypothetical protein
MLKETPSHGADEVIEKNDGAHRCMPASIECPYLIEAQHG